MLNKIVRQTITKSRVFNQIIKIGQRPFSGFQTEMEKFDFTDNYDWTAMGIKNPENR